MGEKPRPLARGELSSPPPPTEEFIQATSLTAPKIVDDDRIAALEQAVIPMQTKLAALETRFNEHRSSVDASISEVKSHLTRQDEAANGRDAKIDSVLSKTDRVLEIIEDRDERERNRRISQLDEREKLATINVKNVEVEVKREEVGRGWLTTTRLVVLIIAGALGIIGTLAMLAGLSQRHGAAVTIKPE